MRRFLAEKPGANEEWDREEALNRLLEQMPAAPVSSNFTARVVACARAGERASARREEEAAVPWIFRSFWARCVAGTAMVCAGFLSFQGYQAAHRTNEAREIAAASQLAALPPMDWWNDFDTIQRLDKVNVADDDLLSVLE
jgi:hypothetical protein